MRKIFVGFFVLLSVHLFSQSAALLLKEASNLERSLKEEQALDKYKQVIAADPKNVTALVKGSELSSAIGARQADKNAKTTFYNMAKEYADRAISLDSNSAAAYYVRALVAGKLT